MKLKKFLSVCVAGAMAATLLVGCGSSDETVNEEIEDETETVVEDAEVETGGDAVETVADDTEEETDNAESKFDGFDETITIKAYGVSHFSTDGLDEVLEAINEISISEINVELDYTMLDFGSYAEQVGLVFSGGEAFDLVMITPLSSTKLSVMMSKGQLMDISDLVDEYAPDAMELMADYIEPYWLDGALYGIPNMEIFNSDYYILMRQDILDYLGLTEQAREIASWSDLEVILEAVYEAQDELPEELKTAAVVSNYTNGAILPVNGFDVATDDFSGHYGFDPLGESNSMLYVDEDNQVKCYFETEDYLATINRCREWYLNGWIYKDAATNVETGDAGLADDLAFCVLEECEVGVEEAKEQATGYPIVAVKCCPHPISTNSVTTWAWGVPATSTEPEAAVAFLNLMFINADIENLFAYGIEGRDYEVNDEGEAVLLDDGVYQSNAYLYPNMFLAYPAEGQGGDFREYSLEVVREGEISPYFGFNVDSDEISNEISAIGAVLDQYRPGLNSGTTDAADVYDDFIDALYDAGMQTVLDFYQENLDAWLAER